MASAAILSQLQAIQRQRAQLPATAATEAYGLGAREEAAAARAAAAPIAARARVDALLAGVPAPLLALSGARASAALTADQRLALENYLLAQQASELRRQLSALEAEAEALAARERAARAGLDAIPSELERLREEASMVTVRCAAAARARAHTHTHTHNTARTHSISRPLATPLAHAQSADESEASAARAIAEASRRAIHDSAQSELARVLGSWGVLAEEAVAAARGEAAAAAGALEAGVQAEAGRARAAVRAGVKAAADSLAEQANGDFDARLAPLLARLDAAAAASGASAAQLGAARARFQALLAAALRGEDTGEDVSDYVATFPALPRGGEGAGGGGGAAGVARLSHAPLLLEAREAAALGLAPAAAREELAALVDSVTAQWVAQGARGLEDAAAFMAELLAVGGDGGGAEAAREAARLGGGAL